ncbi:MAG: hypothetical protein GT589_08680 [Peptoclostridium sp.]|uniref:hypothetical protein n=1 Tax=Peptoclostridium sp. TaxID=1904860 RepID=UPI00139D21F2|nr:hypothetical protein [Peptoclostridium sp.]MZQ76207.1 hypothetical protein [Peptoclostridium sp.]
MGLKLDTSGLLKGLGEADMKMKAAVGVYCDVAGKKLEKWAKNPPYPEKPKAQYTDKQLILFKVLAKQGKIKRQPIQGGPYKWKDRSGRARQTIQGGMEWQGAKCRTFVSGNVDYFEYLEFAHEKKYAVLWPAIQANSKKMLEGMHKILEK